MHNLPNLLLVGAAQKHVGKTEFVCRVIEHLEKDSAVIAVKITLTDSVELLRHYRPDSATRTVAESENFYLTEEHDRNAGTDTDRMLQAGAHCAYWLRAVREHVEPALKQLMPLLPKSTPVVCESNSLRHHLQPGLFVMIQQPDQPLKPSSEALLPLADCTIQFDGSGWDVEPESIQQVAGRWEIACADG